MSHVPCPKSRPPKLSTICGPPHALQLGAQRNDLFGEMQELLKQQQDEVAACRAALALGQQNAAATGAAAASSGTKQPPFHHKAVSDMYRTFLFFWFFVSLRW